MAETGRKNRWALAALVIVLIGFVAVVFRRHPPALPEVRNADESTLVKTVYLPEFMLCHLHMPSHEDYTAPNGSSAFLWRRSSDGCFALWLGDSHGKSREILSAREADVGSGRSFVAKWADDSKALFIGGRYSGMEGDRSPDQQPREMAFIYTIDDNILWEVPSSLLEANQRVSDSTTNTLNSRVRKAIDVALTTMMANTMNLYEIDGLINRIKVDEEVEEGDLLLQLLPMYGGRDEHTQNPELEMAKRLFLGRLMDPMSPSSIVSAIAPHYEVETDPAVRNRFGRALASAALRGGSPTYPNFASFQDYLMQHKANPPLHVVQFMYGMNPERGLDVVRDVFESAQRVQGPTPATMAPSELEVLLEDGKWWDAMYVAEKLLVHPELATLGLIQKMKISPIPLVKETIPQIEARGKR